MKHWRMFLVVGLILVPLFAWMGVGSYYLWITGWGFYVWWPLMACMTLGYWLAWHWQSKKRLLVLKPPDMEVPAHRTSRDEDAWKMVEKRAADASTVPFDKLGDLNFYYDTARAMAQELAAFYHPGTADPVENLRVPEILAVIELAAHDLGELVEEHMPGGHLLTIKDWKQARNLTKTVTRSYGMAMDVYYVVSALFNPVQAGVALANAKLGSGKLWGKLLDMVQQDLYLWFYIAYVKRLGTYLIEVNSGRLRIGATRYRQIVEEMRRQAQTEEIVTEKIAAGPFTGGADDPVDRVKQVTVAMVGQVKAGKSSLINALLGEERARTAVVPMTAGIERFELLTPGIPTRLVLLDSVGYHQTGAKPEQVKATVEAARQADLIFLVLHARNPARQADLDLLEQLERWYAGQPDLKLPPIIAVITHIDLLSPSLEWSPPYDWRQPKRTKEDNIHGAVATVREQLGPRLANVVPVCTQPGKFFGIDEDLLPAVALLLDEVRGVALLRCLRAEADRERVRRVFRQLLATGKAAAQLVWEAIKAPPP